MKPIRIRPRANTEIDALADFIACDSIDAAMRFLDALQKSFDLISEQPGMGTKRYAHLPMLEGLRMLPVSDFEKHLVFYIERPNYIDVLRIMARAIFRLLSWRCRKTPRLERCYPASIHDFFSNLWK